MRYHRVSPDYLPLSNGRKPTLRTCKEDDADRIPNYSTSTLESRALRLRSATAIPSHDTPSIPHDSPSSDAPPTTASKSHPRQEIANGGGDILLQWGHNKRTRGSRAEGRGAAAGDESSGQSRSMAKVPRRGGVLSAAVMLPPPCGSYHRGANLRPCTPSRDASSPLLSRNAEERSGIHGHGHHRSEKRSPPSPSLDAHKLGSGVVPNGCGPNLEPKPAADQETQQQQQQQQQQEKLNLEQFEWPKIYIALSRKEKEDDFLAMKGTKLPQRPKKRAKNIDRTLQYCFPGMWLSDLTRGRYEVREKKCVKKKRRGLKGMESMDSDSE